MMQEIDRFYMREALRLARRGAGKTSPNPMVGAVVVRDGTIVGKGYHREFGGPHAEVFALAQAGEKANGATLYVTLEPCSHYGKTPPCVDQILEAGVKRVVICNRDVNPLVNGKGIRRLLDAGVNVTLDVLAEKGRWLNQAYFTFMEKKRPLVIAKWAQTLDGRIATRSGDSKWISNEQSRKHVHRLRKEVDAVLVGAGTVQTDNPYLTVRHVKGKQPWRVVLVDNWQLDPQFHLFSDEFAQKTIIITSKLEEKQVIPLSQRGVQVEFVKKEPNGDLNLENLLNALYKRKIMSILVEGGRQTLTSFFRWKLVDRICVFVAPKILGDGIQAIGDLSLDSIKESIGLQRVRYRRFYNDILIEGEVNWGEG